MVNKERITFAAFFERFSALTDDKIMDILRSQKDYQDAAREAATRIAIERGLIHSADDLLAPEFQKGGSPEYSAFPVMSNEYYRGRITKSVFKFLYAFSLLPLIFSYYQYNSANFSLAALGASFGVIWFGLVLLVKRTKKTVVIYPLLALVFVAGIYFGVKIVSANFFRFMDFFILIVSVLLASYLLLYVRKLIETK